MRTYPTFTMDYVLYELPMLDGFLFYGWSYSNEPVHLFSGINVYNSPAEQESESLFHELKEIKEKNVFKLFKND